VIIINQKMQQRMRLSYASTAGLMKNSLPSSAECGN